ncbi:MAG: hypothetical protein ACTHMY_12160 [Solirubrobacteraceae bacterium]
MLPTYVALVPLEDDDTIPVDHLVDVAAALQIQVVRDLSPVWHVTGTVSAFARLEDLPPGYIPLAVTKTDLPLHRRGFHFMMGGLPFGVVQYHENDWSIAASHELLEMLCDPFAQRTVLAPSLADEKDRALNAPGAKANPVIDGETGRYVRQGLVNYLVEVCDPCEDSTYQINGVDVSDFVTTAYYGARTASAGPYSFLDRISKELGVLDGGSISWRTLLPQTVVYQAHANDPDGRDNAAAGAAGPPREVAPENLVVRKVVDGSSGLAIASQRSPNRAPSLASDRSYHTTHTSWKRGAPSLRDDLGDLLSYLKYVSAHPAPSIDEVIALLESLLTAGGEWDKFADPNQAFRKDELKKLGLNPSADDLKKKLSRAEYEKVLGYLKAQKKVAGIFGSDIAGNEAALWLCMQIG